MQLNGLSFIGPDRGQATPHTFHATDPASGEALEPPYHGATVEEAGRACMLAGEAFVVYRRVPPAERAVFLRRIADEIDAQGEALTERFVQESGLPPGRAQGERARTCNQLRLFAAALEERDWNRPVIEHARPDRQPLPKPDTRLRYVPVGPVAVFGPANFPLAFTVAGGDTASALAAGCPVVVKAHSSHPGVSELVGHAVRKAVVACGMPDGVFSLIFGSGRELGPALIRHPAIKAAGFTGSQAAGRQLFDLASARPDPIPFFAEMASINPVILFQGQLAEATETIVEGLYASMTLGVGQFCTNPGLVLLPEGDAADTFVRQLADRLSSHDAAPMLNRGTRKSYGEGLDRLDRCAAVDTLLAADPERGPGGCHGAPALYQVRARDFLDTPELGEEVFGPATLLVRCPDADTVRDVIAAAGGQLAISFHANADDIASHAGLIADLETFAGRLVCNGFPTGVEVSASMVHGGPYPATTDGRFTSVGTRAMDRFLRPVCYQDFPREALPEELRDPIEGD
jgi:2,5-dioxopentanoate dehydrogenase